MNQISDSEDRQPCIRLKDVGKAYRMWDRRRDRIKNALLRGIWRRNKNAVAEIDSEAGMASAGTRHRSWRGSYRDFLALKNVSFEVYRGQCVGIVGMNGSGKSTLLQVITGILEPNMGTVDVQGRVSALLELGSGFDPEFTGRENAYLNASILGLTREQIDSRFEEVESFARIGQFMDQAVKTYSSGMVLRLAFAVQILIDPDILVVDEALAVGDISFQRKCFARLEQLRAKGTTILFVSHDMGSVMNLCDTALLLHQGRLIAQGNPAAVANAYHRFIHAPPDARDRIVAEINLELNHAGGPLEGGLHHSDNHPAPDEENQEPIDPDYFDIDLRNDTRLDFEEQGARIFRIRILNEDNQRVNLLRRREFYTLVYTVEFHSDQERVNFAMLIKTIHGNDLGGSRSHPAFRPLSHVDAGSRYEVRFRFQCLLNPEAYCMNAGVEGDVDEKPSYLHRVIDACLFRVLPERDILPTSTVDFLIEPSLEEVEAEALLTSAS